MTDGVRVTSGFDGRGVPRAIMRSRQASERAVELLARFGAREATRLAAASMYPPASSPGSPPARRTGSLEQSIDRSVSVIERDGGFIGIYGTTTGYGQFLELGTSDMAARPFLRPSLDLAAREAGQILRRAFRALGR